MRPMMGALLGSPRPHGNTALLLDQAIRGAEDAGCDVRKIVVPTLEFSACREIYYCRDQPACRITDDVTGLYPFFSTMDSLILATPVMTMGVPGALKSFMDRFQVFYCAKYERKSPLVLRKSAGTAKRSSSRYPA
jgi:multimeric flavodoxin WrbA